MGKPISCVTDFYFLQISFPCYTGMHSRLFKLPSINCSISRSIAKFVCDSLHLSTEILFFFSTAIRQFYNLMEKSQIHVWITSRDFCRYPFLGNRLFKLPSINFIISAKFVCTAWSVYFGLVCLHGAARFVRAPKHLCKVFQIIASYLWLAKLAEGGRRLIECIGSCVCRSASLRLVSCWHPEGAKRTRLWQNVHSSQSDDVRLW